MPWLTAAGCTRATAHYRQPTKKGTRKLYLVTPTDPSTGRRDYIYVGTDAGRQAEALAAVDRWHRRDCVREQIADLDMWLSRLKFDLRSVIGAGRALAKEAEKAVGMHQNEPGNADKRGKSRTSRRG